MSATVPPQPPAPQLTGDAPSSRDQRAGRAALRTSGVTALFCVFCNSAAFMAARGWLGPHVHPGYGRFLALLLAVLSAIIVLGFVVAQNNVARTRSGQWAVLLSVALVISEFFLREG